MTTHDAASAIAGTIFPADHHAHADCVAWLATQPVTAAYAAGTMDLEAAPQVVVDASVVYLRAAAEVVAEVLGRDARQDDTQAATGILE
jgi:hypothetical protein